MTHLYLYQNGVRGDVMLSRALYRSVIASGRFELTIGVCRTDAELLDDLVGPRCALAVSEFGNTPFGSPLDLAVLCPPGAVAIQARLVGADDVPTRQWPDTVEGFHRDLRRHGIDAEVADPDGEVPMLDFASTIEVTAPRRPSIYVDSERTDEPTCWFVYDIERLLRVLPDHDLLCTDPRGAQAENLVDIGHLSWPQRSRLSEACVVLIGTTCDPFAVTLTEANRHKPKALCGYDPRKVAPFWDYAGNPTELLATMDELVDFLLANVAEATPAGGLLP